VLCRRFFTIQECADGASATAHGFPTMSTWRDDRNAKSRARLERRLSEAFPACVLDHALRQPLIPPTQRRAMEAYWRHHPLRADRLARALAARSGAPEGWVWRLGREKDSGLPLTFRVPPAPYREAAFSRGDGHCCVCGQPVYRLGWHRDPWGDGKPNRNATWHAACVVAWQLWTAPSDHLRPLKLRQSRKCPLTGRRLLKTAEVDHRIPLYEVWAAHRSRRWPDLLAFWGAPNLQVVNKAAHLEKCSQEAANRAERRAVMV
jgi:5-methylcytosine-specific restriction endonuclease McrA